MKILKKICFVLLLTTFSSVYGGDCFKDKDVDDCRVKAEQGDAHAQGNLGVMYRNELYKKDYIKHLNKCSNEVSSHSVDNLAVFSGINLNESCIYEEFKKHHKEHKIKDLHNEGEFLSNHDIEIKDEGDFKTITALYDFTCGEVCRVGKNIILYDNEKYYLVVDWDADYGYSARFKSNNQIHIYEYMYSRTNNIIFDIERGALSFLGSGDTLWRESSYKKVGVKSYFFGGGAFWYDAEYQYDGTIIKLIDYEGEYKSCFSLNHFQGNEFIFETMKKNNQDKLCVNR